jgi:hypothetical protein
MRSGAWLSHASWEEDGGVVAIGSGVEVVRLRVEAAYKNTRHHGGDAGHVEERPAQFK